MTIQEKQQKVVEEFFLEDWMDKYEYPIELGKTFPPLDDSSKQEKESYKRMSIKWFGLMLEERTENSSSKQTAMR